MTTDEAMAVLGRLKRKGNNARVREDYSGRGMFGATTTAIVTDCKPETKKYRVDQMGKNWIIY